MIFFYLHERLISFVFSPHCSNYFEWMALWNDKAAESQYFSLRNEYDGMLIVLAMFVSSGIIAIIWSLSISSTSDKSSSIGRFEKGNTIWKEIYLYVTTQFFEDFILLHFPFQLSRVYFSIYSQCSPKKDKIKWTISMCRLDAW